MECDYIGYSPAETSTRNTRDSQIYINITEDGSVISLLYSYLDLNFEVTKEADKSRYGNGNDIRLFNSRPVAFSSKF